MEDEVRTWKDAVEDALKEKVPPTHDLLAWMVEHAMSVDRRTAIGEDGKTPLERIRGRRGRDVMAEFAESVLFIPLRGNISDSQKAKINLEPRFQDGVFLGLSDRSDEILVWCKEGIPSEEELMKKDFARMKL